MGPNMRYSLYMPKMHCGLFLTCHSVHPYMHTLETKGQTRTFYLSNESSLMNISTLWVRGVCKVWWVSYRSKRTSQLLSSMILCAYIHALLKYYWLYLAVVHTERLLYNRTYLFTVFQLDARYNCRVYGSKHASQSLSNKPFVHTYTDYLKTTCHIYGCSAYQTTVILFETFLVRLRAAWEIYLKMYGPRHASVVLLYNIVCLYCKPVHIACGVQQLMTTKLK